MYKGKKIVVVLPAYNADLTLSQVYHKIPKDIVDEILLVDDASSDSTVKLAKELGIEVFCHKKNLGYGANQKTCYDKALKKNPDIVVMLHPDYQYPPERIPDLIRPIAEGRASLCLGSRITTREEVLAGKMPLYKYIANRFLTLVENFITGQNLSEWHTGFRAFSADFLKKIPYKLNSNDFVFDTQILLQAVSIKARIEEIKVPAKYFKEASSINFKRSLKYGILTLWYLLRWLLHYKLCLIKYKPFQIF
jgi:glycosyltransferase involved in cell wall biosynthesis